MRMFFQSVTCMWLRCLNKRALYLAVYLAPLFCSVVLAQNRNGNLLDLALTRGSSDSRLLELIQGIAEVHLLPDQLNAAVAASTARSLPCRISDCFSSSEVQVVLRYADEHYAEGSLDFKKCKSDHYSAILEKWEPCRKTLLATNEYCWFLGSLWSSDETQFSPPGKLLSAAKMEALRAKLCLCEMDFVNAIQAVGNILHLARSLDCNWTVMSRLVQTKVIHIAEDVVRGMQKTPAVTEESLSTLRENVTCSLELIKAHSLRPWIGLRAEGLLLYEMIRAGQTNLLSPYGEEEARFLRTQIDSGAYDIDADEAFFLECMGSIIDIADEPYEDHIEFWNNLDSELQKKSHVWKESTRRMDPRYAPVSVYLLCSTHVSFKKYRESIDSFSAAFEGEAPKSTTSVSP